MESKFVIATDNLALNLVNTQIMRYKKKIELINDETDLLSWILIQKKLTSSIPKKYQLDILESAVRTQDITEKVLKLREVIGNELQHFMNHEISLENWISDINKKLHNLPFTSCIVDKEHVLVPYNSTGYRAFLSVIYLSLSELIENEDIKKLKHCANPECILIFLDKTGRRKWCSMDICGNRNKSKKFTKKQKEKYT
ncbi:CGNR zinc finger domain-containing protein [Lactococcus sp. LG606]|uniref:CGNR zinc finger domain-containing protein n=1 Tax=Lactococcus sp. LG606 TaxID=2816912 RepID=UPI001A8CBE48|nr:CGNR zinc finger domain-containing protein [Lactococcus sp. LG606]QSR13029.1 CGNR zinc finger domain-containing protein [Lactococcus sp. LG606]